MENIKLKIDNTSLTIGETLYTEKNVNSTIRDCWWYDALHNIKFNQVYTFEYMFKHNPTKKALLVECDSSIFVKEGMELNNQLLNDFSEDYSPNEIRRYANQIITLLGTHELDKERYLKIKSSFNPEVRDLVQRALEFGIEEDIDAVFAWVCLSMLISCKVEEVGKKLDDTNLTIADIIENTKAETKKLIGKDWKKNPIVKELNLTKKQLIEIWKQGRLEKVWS